MSLYVNITAGEILLLLDEKRRAMSLEEVCRCLRKPVSTVNLAVGRLIREALINMKTRGNTHCIIARHQPETKETTSYFGEACCAV